MTDSPTLARLQAEHPEWAFQTAQVNGVALDILEVLTDAITALDAENEALRAQLAEAQIVLTDIARLVEEDPSTKARIITFTVQAILKEKA